MRCLAPILREVAEEAVKIEASSHRAQSADAAFSDCDDGSLDRICLGTALGLLDVFGNVAEVGVERWRRRRWRAACSRALVTTVVGLAIATGAYGSLSRFVG